MKTQLRSRDQIAFLLGVSFLLIAILACNPVAKFTKQYKCTVHDKPEPKTPYEYVNRGVEHMDAGELDCAMGACSEAIRLDSRFAKGYACRAGVLNARDEYSKALKDVDYALSLEPNNGDFYYSRALVQEHLGKPEQVLADLAKALELISSEVGRSFAQPLVWRASTVNLVF
jgi:tetratricopeptide (TPR) repeat protein